MIINITANGNKATDLSWLSHKNPDKLHSIKSTTGEMYLFFKEYTDEKTTISLILDVDTLNLTPKSDKNYSFDLKPYINDKPYCINSFFSTALNKILSSAIAGKCDSYPDLVDKKMNFTIEIPIIWFNRNQKFFNDFFEPLGYTIDIQKYHFDNRKPEWGWSNYYKLILNHTEITFKDLLNQLYIVFNLFDEDKHYYTKDEQEKLIRKGGEWLNNHPLKEIIINLYLDINKPETNKWFKTQYQEKVEFENQEENTEIENSDFVNKRFIYNQIIDRIKNKNGKRIADIGTGRGSYIYEFKDMDWFESLIFSDVSNFHVEKLKLTMKKAGLDKNKSVSIIKTSLYFNDDRLKNQDFITLIDVLNYIPEENLDEVFWNLFVNYQPNSLIITYKLTDNLRLNWSIEKLKEVYFDKIHNEWNYVNFIEKIDDNNLIIYFEKL